MATPNRFLNGFPTTKSESHHSSGDAPRRPGSTGSPIYLPNLGSKFSRTKSFCFENCILLAFGLDMCEGVSEDSGHEIGHVDIQVGSCIYLSVFGSHDMCT